MRKSELMPRTRAACVAGALAALTLATVAPPAPAAQKASLIARLVVQVPDQPDDPQWSEADELQVPLAPQAVVKPRTYEAAVQALQVRALYDADRLAVRLQWQDPQRDGMAGQVEAFRDAVALEFPSDPGAGIPFFGMGEAQRPITIYQWKADFHGAFATDVDERYPAMAVDWYPLSGRAPHAIAEVHDYGSAAGDRAYITAWRAGNLIADQEVQQRTGAEKLVAKGFGTVTSVPAQAQDGMAEGTWQDGVWRVVITLPRDQDGFAFERGMTVPVAFAAWDGAARERGGEKGVSTWYFLSLEQPVNPLRMYLVPLLVIAAAAGLQFAALRRWRARAAVSPAG